MTSEPLSRNNYIEDGPIGEYHPPHERSNARGDDLHTKDHYDEFGEYHMPMARLHNVALHDSGIAQGLEVSGIVGATAITIEPGVAIDAQGQLISLATVA